ncbi:MAG: hypothetical protein LBL61_05755, partial [Elusimicrobiota bacterium]|nr:hypothetical protein [Elusimicrobiota bacterium]
MQENKKTTGRIAQFFAKVKNIFVRRPLLTGGALLLIIIIAIILLDGKKIISLRKYNEAGAVDFSMEKVYPPYIYTDSDGKVQAGTPRGLYINFNEDIHFGTEGERAALKDIKITPAVAGDWEWQGSNRLAFTPAKQWPANAHYTVKFPKNLAGSGADVKVKLARYDFTFDTPPFKTTLDNFSLYQDPQNPKIYTALAEFGFSHPVAAQDFEKALTLELDKKPLRYDVVYDESKYKATVKSVPITIKESPQLAMINVAAFNGSAAIRKPLDIQGSDKFFRIESVSSSIIRNQQDEPEQILFVNFTDAVPADALAGKVSAYALPKINKNKDKRASSQAQACREVEEERCDCHGEGVSESPIDISDLPVSDNEEGGDYNASEDCFCQTVTVTRCDSQSGSDKNEMWVLDDITPQSLSSLKKIALTAVPSADGSTKTFALRYGADNETNPKIYVSVKTPLVSLGGFEIKTDKNFIVSVPSYPTELKIAGAGSLLALGGSKKLSFVSRGIDGIKVEISRILPGQINHLVSQTYGSFSRPYFESSYYFNENNISENFEEIIPLARGSRKANYSSLDLGRYLTPGKTGLFLLKTTGWNPAKKTSQTNSETRFILVSDLALLVKKDIDNNRRVYVMSVSSGGPAAGVKVEVLGRNGLPLFTKYTGENGYADFPSLNDFKKEKEPVVFVATLGSDVSFIPLQRGDREVDYSRFEKEGVYYSSYKNKGLGAFLFSGRGIYRPGEDINIAAMVKTPDWGYVGGIPVKFLLQDPRGKNVFEKTVSLPADGLVDFTVPTQPAYLTGTYQAYLYDDADKKRPVQLGNASVRVEEFREDKLRVKAQILGGGRKGWQPAQGLWAKVSVQNLYGSPAQSYEDKARLDLQPVNFRFPKYKDYSFVDPDSRKNESTIKSASISLIDDARTNADGEARADIDLSAYSGGSYRLTLNAEAFEQESGAGVYAGDSVQLSPAHYLAGYKSADRLDYLKRGASAAVNFIAVDPDLEQIALPKLTARIIARQHVSTLVKQYNGSYKYQSVLKEEEKSSKPFEIKKEGSSVILDTSAPGQYALEISDEFNNKLARAEYFVSGSANLTYSLEKDAELKLALENTEIAPGGDLTLNIITPYAGAGLITIEREKVFAQKWFRTATTSTQQTITVPADFEGNGYVNVSFVRGADSTDIYSSPHSYAV